MRRALFAILLLGLLASVPATTWAATPPDRIRAILRDCEDDGSLSGSYRPSELRDAVRNIGTDLDQYSDCRDVISAAVLQEVSGGNAPGAGGSGTGGGSAGAPATGAAPAAGGAVPSGGAGSNAGAGSTGGPGSSGATVGGGRFGGAGTLAPEDRGEIEALEKGRHTAPGPTVVGGTALDVAAPRGVAAVIAHDLPTPVLVALAALALGTLAAALPPLRRRVRARRAA